MSILYYFQESHLLSCLFIVYCNTLSSLLSPCCCYHFIFFFSTHYDASPLSQATSPRGGPEETPSVSCRGCQVGISWDSRLKAPSVVRQPRRRLNSNFKTMYLPDGISLHYQFIEKISNVWTINFWTNLLAKLYSISKGYACASQLCNRSIKSSKNYSAHKQS